MTNKQDVTEITRIEDSHYFTDQTNVYYLLSSDFNSSGFMGETNAIDTFEVRTEDSDVKFDFPFSNNTVILVSKEQFWDHYDYSVEDYASREAEIITIAIKIPEIKLEGFKVIGQYYGEFKTKLFYKYENIKHADNESFEIFKNDWDRIHYSKDKNHVYFKNNILTAAQPSTFGFIDQEHEYYKDDKHVYKHGVIINKADPKSFEVISHTYQKDQNHVFLIGKPTKIDACSFKLISDDSNEEYALYAVDKNNVYFQGEIIAKADVKSFRLLNDMYGIDKNNVFYFGERLESGDVKTFKVTERKTAEISYDAQDKNYFFTGNELTKKGVD